MKPLAYILLMLVATLCPNIAFASGVIDHTIDLTNHWLGYTIIAIFVVAYILVIFEEQLHLRKSKPVIISAALIWGFIAYYYSISKKTKMITRNLTNSKKAW